MELQEAIQSIEAELIEIRRGLHTYPELGWQEFRTTAVVAKWVTDLGYEVQLGKAVCDAAARMGVPSEEELAQAYERALAEGADPELLEQMRGGFTGAVATLRNGPGPTVAMRFDIDALPMQETDDPEHTANKGGFASQHSHVMHACGHDVHTTVGMGVAKIMADSRAEWSGTLKLIFQPAEEGVRGAKSIVAAGHLDDVDFLLGAHIETGKGDGTQIYAGAGGTLATTKFNAYFTGTAAHAGLSPEKGRNVISAIATAALNVAAIPRHSGGASRVNVGKIVAGAGRNIVADEGHMEIEVRGTTSEVNDYMSQQTERILQAAAQMHDVQVNIVKMGEAPSLESDPELMERVAGLLRGAGLAVGQPNRLSLSASEDFAFMSNRVQQLGGQATYMPLISEITKGMHAVTTDIAEESIALGVQAFVIAAKDLFGRC